MTRVSVVIPVRNDADMLRACLEALARQTRAADEVVVVDNAGSDDSAAVAASFGARVVPEPCVGIPAATATGMDAATGDVIARIDADTRVPDDWLERVERLFDGHPEAAAVTGPGEFYGAGPLARFLGRRVYIGGYFGVLPVVLWHRPLFGSNMAMRSDAWARVAPRVHRQEPGIHDDLDISFALAPDMTVLYEPTLVVGVSARPFASRRALLRRLRWAAATLRLDVPLHPPVARLRARRRAAQRGAVTPRAG